MVLDIAAPRTSVDGKDPWSVIKSSLISLDMNHYLLSVNVTPDKRNIMIEREKYLLAVIRASLNALFRDTPSTFNTAKSLGCILPQKSEAGGSGVPEKSFSLATLTMYFPSKRPAEDDSHPTGKEPLGERQTILPAVTVPVIPTKKKAISDTELSEVPEGDGRGIVTLTRVEEQRTSSSKSSKPDSVIVEDDSEKPRNRRRTKVTFSMEQMGRGNISSGDKGEKFRRFLSKISPEDNASAESELNKHFSKADFLSMRVMGQFNKGFIIARLNDDLFIGKKRVVILIFLGR